MIAEGNASDFVRLSLGKTRLLLPAAELLSITSVADVRPLRKGNDVYGSITIDNTDVPVYAFDDNLYLSSATNNNRQVCVCLNDGQSCIGILCDNADKIILDDIKRHELPDCMLDADAFIQAVIESSNNLYCVSKTTDLIRLAGKKLIRE